MIRFQLVRETLGVLALGLALGAFASQPALGETPPAAGTRSDVLEAEPVGLHLPAPKLAATPEPTPAAPTTSEVLSAEFGVERLLLPYYFSAYQPRLERTEVDLGFYLSQNPGVDVSVAWGAMPDLMAAAKIVAMGASSTVGLGLKYLVLPETPASSKPAIAAVVQTLFINDRTLGQPRENIFRGSRVQTGVVLSKDLGSLAAALQAGESLRGFLGFFRLHAEALVEYRGGRSGTAEDAVGLADAGAKIALEALVIPGELYATLAYDTLPDWVDEQNYYLGVRYFSQPDLAFDVIAGRLQNGNGVEAAISWIF
jgi:hypothetical protein